MRISVIVTGELREPLEAQFTFDTLLEFRNRELIDEIIFPCWQNDAVNNPEFIGRLDKSGVRVVVSLQPKVPGIGYVFRQIFAFHKGLDVAEGTFILKLRTDQVSVNFGLLDNFLSRIRRGTDADFESDKLYVQYYGLSLPFFIGDRFFFGPIDLVKRLFAHSIAMSSISGSLNAEQSWFGAFNYSININAQLCHELINLRALSSMLVDGRVTGSELPEIIQVYYAQYFCFINDNYRLFSDPLSKKAEIKFEKSFSWSLLVAGRHALSYKISIVGSQLSCTKHDLVKEIFRHGKSLAADTLHLPLDFFERRYSVRELEQKSAEVVSFFDSISAVDPSCKAVRVDFRALLRKDTSAADPLLKDLVSVLPQPVIEAVHGAMKTNYFASAAASLARQILAADQQCPIYVEDRNRMAVGASLAVKAAMRRDFSALIQLAEALEEGRWGSVPDPQRAERVRRYLNLLKG